MVICFRGRWGNVGTDLRKQACHVWGSVYHHPDLLGPNRRSWGSYYRIHPEWWTNHPVSDYRWPSWFRSEWDRVHDWQPWKRFEGCLGWAWARIRRWSWTWSTQGWLWSSVASPARSSTPAAVAATTPAASPNNSTWTYARVSRIWTEWTTEHLPISYAARSGLRTRSFFGCWSAARWSSATTRFLESFWSRAGSAYTARLARWCCRSGWRPRGTDGTDRQPLRNRWDSAGTWCSCLWTRTPRFCKPTSKLMHPYLHVVHDVLRQELVELGHLR